MKIETDGTDPDHSPIFKDITAQVIATDLVATLDHSTGTVHDDLTQPTGEHSHKPCHDAPLWSHHRSSQHQSSSGYQSLYCSRSHT